MPPRHFGAPSKPGSRNVLLSAADKLLGKTHKTQKNLLFPRSRSELIRISHSFPLRIPSKFKDSHKPTIHNNEPRIVSVKQTNIQFMALKRVGRTTTTMTTRDGTRRARIRKNNETFKRSLPEFSRAIARLNDKHEKRLKITRPSNSTKPTWKAPFLLQRVITMTQKQQIDLRNICAPSWLPCPNG